MPKGARARGRTAGGHHDHHHKHHEKHEEEEEDEQVDDDDKFKRSVFPPSWVEEAEDNEHARIAPQELLRDYGVPPMVITKFLEHDIREAQSCKTMPFTLLLVFAYACVIITNDNAPASNAVEDSIAFDIGENANFAFNGPMGFKGMFDVNSATDFWAWLSQGLIPLIFAQSRGYSEDFFTEEIYELYNTSGVDAMQRGWRMNESQRGLYINHNRIIGGIRISQERFEPNIKEGEPEWKCSSPLDLQVVYDMDCVGGHKFELDPEMWDARSTADEARKRTVWIYTDNTMDSMQSVVWEMERSGWFDKKTQKVEIALPVYNAEYGIHALIHCNFFVSRGGHLWKTIIPLSVFSDLLDGWFKIASDITFIVLLLCMLFAEAVLLVTIIRTKGITGIVNTLMQPVNLVDVIGVLVGLAVCTMMGFLFKFVGDLNDAGAVLGTKVKERDYNGYREEMETYVWEIENAVHYYHKLRLVMAGYPLVIIFRLFKAFSAQARLAVVTNSLSRASVDLFHFLIIFLAIFGIYQISAVSLFGHSVDDLATISRGMTTNFLAMLGDFDWDLIKIVGRKEAGVWFWTFMLLVSMVLMNMLIAIVMDAYSEVKDAAKDSKNTWEEIAILGRRAIGEHASLRKTVGRILPKFGLPNDPLVPLEEIVICIKGRATHLKKLRRIHQIRYDDWEEESRHQKEAGFNDPIPVNPKDCPDDYEVGNLRVESLCKLVHGLSETQGEELLNDSLKRYYEANQRPASYEDVRTGLQSLAHDYKLLKHCVAQALKEPNTDIPECSYEVHCAMESLWFILRADDATRHAHDWSSHPHTKTAVPQNVKERVTYLEKELSLVRGHVEEELASVSKLHREVSRVQQEKVTIERACHTLQSKLSELKVENQVLLSQLTNGHVVKNDAAVDRDDVSPEVSMLRSWEDVSPKARRPVDGHLALPALDPEDEPGGKIRKALAYGSDNGSRSSGRRARRPARARSADSHSESEKSEPIVMFNHFNSIQTNTSRIATQTRERVLEALASGQDPSAAKKK